MNKPAVYVLGIHSSHDASACLLKDGEIAVAIELERLSRAKHDWGRSGLDTLVQYCLDSEGIALSQVACVVTSEIANIPRSQLINSNEHHITHHLAHAWAAVGLSPFAECAVLVVDGEGSRVAELELNERAVCSPCEDYFAEKESLYAFDGKILKPILKATSGRGCESPFSGTDAMGSPYWFLSQLVFGKEHCESKVMGLAAYGHVDPRYDGIYKLEPGGRVEIDPNWIFRIDLPTTELDDHFLPYADLAASIQKQLEGALLHRAAWLRSYTDLPALAYAGGVALNCVANTVLQNAGLFNDVYVPFGAGDSSIAIGCAMYGWHVILENQKRSTRAASPYCGKRYTPSEVNDALQVFIDLKMVSAHRVNSVEPIVDSLIDGEAVAIFDGCSEFGPRALGNRSILADARSSTVRDMLNKKVKYREPYRPFAIIILEEHAQEWLEIVPRNCFEMQFTARLRPEKQLLLPSAVHVDGTSRIQIVRTGNAETAALSTILTWFFERTGVPLLINTSFNIQEPIVETPKDSLLTFVSSKLDALWLQGYLVRSKVLLAQGTLDSFAGCVLLWLEDIELYEDYSRDSRGIRFVRGTHTSYYQGWHRAISSREGVSCSPQLFEFIRELAPKRGDFIVESRLQALTENSSLKEEIETQLFKRRIAVLVVPRPTVH